METKYQCPRENRENQVGLKEKGETQSYQSKTKFQEQEGNEEDICGPIAPSADLGHNENAILVEVNQAMKNALVEGGGNTKYPSFTIHYKEPTGVPKETENQPPREHRQYQAGITERDETHGTPPKKRTKIQPEHQDNEGDISDCIPMNPENEGKNARLGEICDQKQNVSQEENARMIYPHEDESSASTEDIPVTQTLCTEKMKEDDHAAQSLQPTGEGTEGEVLHQPSPFRRTRTIWKNRRSLETQKQATRKAKSLENKENTASEYGSEKEVVREQVLKEVNEQDRTEEQNLPQ